MFALIVLIALPLAELAVFVEVGRTIGLAPTLGLVALSTLSGVVLVRLRGLAALRRAAAVLESGRLPVREVFDGLCVVIAGLLLIVPGFITDFLALLLLIPGMRPLLYALAADRLRRRAAASSPVIDAEFREIDTGPARVQEPSAAGEHCPQAPSVLATRERR